MFTPDKVFLIHDGALGDFLLAWPALRSLALHFAGRPLFWAGRPAYAPWVAPLGLAFCPPTDRDRLMGLDLDHVRPPGLEGALVARLGLGRRPEASLDEGFWYLPGLAPGRSPREVYAEELARRGVAWAGDWLEAFRGHFGNAPARGRDVLLFAGAGHRLKQWPLVQFLELAAWLREAGFAPCFVLGPAELERGLAPSGWPALAPPDLAGLAQALRGARLAVGNDCGPMHLAGMLGLPGLALFGPTDPRQWAAPGLRALSLGLGCSPCTLSTRDLDCPDPRCLADLPQEAVRRALAGLLET